MSETKARKIGRIKAKNVRISFWFPEGRPPKDAKPGEEDKLIWNPSFLMSKETEEGQALKKLISDEIKAVMREKWHGKVEKLKPEKLCLRDGDVETYDGYAGHYYISTSSKRKPQLVDRIKGRDGKWLEAAPGKIYSGCYCNAIITIWAQDNEHGKRVNASIEVIQFLRDGEAFGDTIVDANDELDEDDVGSVGDITDTEEEDIL